MVPRFVSRLRQSKTNFAIAVPGGPFRPGDQVAVQVSFLPEEDLYLQEGSVALVCHETFWYTVKSTGARWIGTYPGHAEENYKGPPYTAAGKPGKYKASKDLVRRSQRFLLDGRFPKGVPYVSWVNFRLPEAAPPSLNGDIVRIEWQLEASVLTVSTNQERAVEPLSVVSPEATASISQERQTPATVAVEIEFKQCVLSMLLPAIPATAGRSLEGVFVARLHHDQHVSGVRVELERFERAGAKESTVTSDYVSLQANASLRAGMTYQWPFRLRVPAQLLPSVSVDETTVSWRVTGILCRSIFPDISITGAVSVCTTPELRI